MDNPLELPKPEDPIQEIHDYARDLAYLAVYRLIESKIQVKEREWLDNPHINNQEKGRVYHILRWKFSMKWTEQQNSTAEMLELLTSYGYLDAKRENYPYAPGVTNLVAAYSGEPQYHTILIYSITPKAFDLLEKPIKPPQIFISYRRKESSAFALLIEARLRLLGVDTVFIDKYLQAGDKWHGELETRIKNCPIFISLIGPDSLKSKMVLQEIDWAVEAESRIITIWHNGCKINDNCPPDLQKRQAITVSSEGAKEYETAINELLNSLGYRTY